MQFSSNVKGRLFVTDNTIMLNAELIWADLKKKTVTVIMFWTCEIDVLITTGK